MAASFQIALTAEKFKALVARYGGGANPPDAGTLPETMGVVLGYSLNRVLDATVVVTFTVVKKPWVFSVAMIQNRIQQMVEQV